MPSELLPGGEPSGLLSGLVHGYLGAQSKAAQDQLQQRISSRDSMIRYLGALAQDQSIPPEHQQWALQKIQEGLQHDVSKKPWEVKLSEMPPVSVQRPGAISSQTLPGGSTPPPGLASAIQAPQPPPGASGAPQAPANDVGRASNGTVNALGAAGGASGGVQLPQPPPVVGMPIRTLPQNQAVQAPTPPPDQISSGGLHVLTPADRLKFASAQEQEQLVGLQKQFPQKSTEELAYFAKHGEFPKADEFSLTPGEKRFRGSEQIAENTSPKAGAKSGYTPHTGTGGEPMGVVDNATGAFLSPSQAAKIPEAKAAYDASVTQHQQRRTEQLQDQKAITDRQFALAGEHEREGLRKEGRGTIAKSKLAHDADTDRLGIMEQNYEAALKGDQQAMLSLLSNHVGMTLGLQKSARITKAFYEEAQNSAPWLAKTGAKFDDRGYLSGVTLAPEQMSQMVELGRQKEAQSRERMSETQNSYSDVLKEGGKGSPKAAVEKPKAPQTQAGGYTPPPGAPSRVGPNGHTINVDNGRWVDSKTGKPL